MRDQGIELVRRLRETGVDVAAHRLSRDDPRLGQLQGHDRRRERGLDSCGCDEALPPSGRSRADRSRHPTGDDRGRRAGGPVLLVRASARSAVGCSPVSLSTAPTSTGWARGSTYERLAAGEPLVLEGPDGDWSGPVRVVDHARGRVGPRRRRGEVARHRVDRRRRYRRHVSSAHRTVSRTPTSCGARTSESMRLLSSTAALSASVHRRPHRVPRRGTSWSRTRRWRPGSSATVCPRR